MINRETYLSRIRPFIGNELIKVLTGVRRSGKSVILELIQNELIAQGVSSSQFIKLNFEDMNNTRLCTAEALHKLYVQVSYLLASEEVVRREFEVYESIRDNFPKYVVSLDEIDMSREGVKHKNIRDFLLAPEWN